MKFLGRNSQKWAQESRFSAEKDGTKTEVSENGHFWVGNLEGRQVHGNMLSNLIRYVFDARFETLKS